MPKASIMAKVNYERIIMSTEPHITKKIREQILVVRKTGRTNMFDIPSVMRVAYELELFDLVSFLTVSTNQSEYCDLIVHGDKHE